MRASLTVALFLAIAIAITPAPAIATAGAEILDSFFTRAAEEDEVFQPYRFRTDSHTWVRDGKGKLEYEGKEWVVGLTSGPDETEILESGSEVIFDAEADEKADEKNEEEEAEDEGEDEDGSHSEEAEFNFLDPEKRDEYVYEFAGLTADGGRKLARFDFQPRKRRKETWQGSFWIDAETGALDSVDVQPAKKRFGLKALRIQGDMRSFHGMTVPAHLDTRIEFKIPLLVHVRVRSVADFSAYELVEE